MEHLSYKPIKPIKHIKPIKPKTYPPLPSSHIDVVEFNDKLRENNEKSLIIYGTNLFNLVERKEYNIYKNSFKESHRNTNITPNTKNRVISNIKILIIKGEFLYQKLAFEYVQFLPFINIFYNIFILSIFGGYDEYSSVWVESNIQSEVINLEDFQTSKTDTPENLNIKTCHKTSNFLDMHPSYIESKKKLWGIFDMMVNPDNYLYIPSVKQSTSFHYPVDNLDNLYVINKDRPDLLRLILSDCDWNKPEEISNSIEYREINWYELNLTHPIIYKYHATSDIIQRDNSNEEISNGIRVKRNSAPSILQHGEFKLLKDTQSPIDSVISERDVMIMELNNNISEKDKLLKTAFKAIRKSLMDYRENDTGKTHFSTSDSDSLHLKIHKKDISERNRIIFELTLKNLDLANAIQSHNKEIDFHNNELLKTGIELSKETDTSESESEALKVNDDTLDKVYDLEDRLKDKTHELELEKFKWDEIGADIKNFSKENSELYYTLKIKEEELNLLRKDLEKERELSSDYIEAYHDAQKSNKENKTLIEKLQSQVLGLKNKLDYYVRKEMEGRTLEELAKRNL